MIKQALAVLIIVSVGSFAFGQDYQFDGYDAAPADTNYWQWYDNVVAGDTTSPGGHYSVSGLAHPDTGWAEINYVTSPVFAGDGAVQIDYSAHNVETWGGYTKIEHWNPDSTQTYDWSAFDSISFRYNNTVAQSLAGRVHVRFCLQDVSDSPNGNNTYTNEEAEYYYSFQYILDNAAGWNEIKMPIEASPDYWGGEGFNRTGWAGITGNDILDKDKIKGFSIEFSISGGGDGDFAEGQIVFDEMVLTGPQNTLVFSPGFEDGGDPNDQDLPIGWGVWQVAWDGWGGLSHITTQSGGGHRGEYWLEMSAEVGNGYAVAFQGAPIQANAGEEWVLGSWIKDIAGTAGDTSDAALKLEAFDADGNNLGAWEILQEGVTTDWRYFSTSQIMPTGTDSVNAVLVVTKWGDTGIEATYGFDDVVLFNTGEVDMTAPDCPTGLLAIASDYANLVSWVDVDSTDGELEAGETYTLYASMNPITDLSSPDVEVVQSGINEGLQTAVHYLKYPLVDTDVDMYYAMTCTDAAFNTSDCFTAIGTPTNNLAKGIATVSLNPPATFAADGDLSEWYSSSIMPFVLMPSTHYAGLGSFTDDDDLTATVFLAMDDEYFYVGVDVIDDLYNFNPEENWWDQDGFDFFFGLYDNRTGKHAGYERGSEPDYKLYMTEEVLQVDNPGNAMLYDPDSADYHFESFGASDYVIETKIPLAELAARGEDDPFVPTRGMKIPLELYFHDNDAPDDYSGGNLAMSPFNTDNGHNTPTQWTYTWIGDTTHTVGVDDKDEMGLATKFSLSQNYPNPFNPVTTINYTLGTAGSVDIKIFNLLGVEVAHLVNKYQPAGVYSIQWNAKNIPSGVYFYRLKGDNFTSTRKMVLMK